VSRAKVKIEDQIVGEIGQGLLVLLGVGKGDSELEAARLLEKVIQLRVFDDPQGKMNLSLLEINGELMVISQFTLYADCRKGRRPSFTSAAPAAEAKALYETFLTLAKTKGIKVSAGTFQTLMDVELNNHGPVTICLDTAVDF
jgi:D-aminoacyl-tRNA deacylase